MKVAVVDGSRVMAKILAGMIAERGDDVTCFDRAEAAIDHLRENVDVGVLLTSIELPGAGGLELCWEARTLSGEERYLHIVVMSSSSDRRRLVEVLDAGADDFIQKPVDKMELHARLRTAERLIRGHGEILRLATTDGLTGALNRRAFVARLDEVAASGAQAALAMFDLDHFKRINDTYGHDGGDAVLVAVAGCAGAVEGATLGRLGGEEFALLLPGVDLAEAVVRMNALRRTLRALDVVVRERPVPVSASFGVAEFCNGASVDDVLKNADVALYHAKSSGRDRVSVCGVLAAAE